MFVAIFFAACGGAAPFGTEASDDSDLDVQIQPDQATVLEGEIVHLDARVQNTSSDDTISIVWASRDSSIAQVDSDGAVTGVLEGTTEIIAQAGQGADSATVEVQAPPQDADPDLVEDFSNYSSTTDLLDDPRGIYLDGSDMASDHIVLDTETGVSNLGLNQSMRYDYNDVGTISRGLDLPVSGTNELWTEVWAKFSPNFKTDWGGNDSNPDFKFIFATTDPSRFSLDTGSGGGSYDIGTPAGTQPGTSPTSQQDWDGEWHRFRIHFRHESSDGACDGTATVQIDNRPMFGSEGDVCTNRSAGEMTYLPLGRNMNQTPEELIQLWWGRIAVWTADPGW